MVSAEKTKSWISASISVLLYVKLASELKSVQSSSNKSQFGYNINILSSESNDTSINNYYYPYLNIFIIAFVANCKIRAIHFNKNQHLKMASHFRYQNLFICQSHRWNVTASWVLRNRIQHRQTNGEKLDNYMPITIGAPFFTNQ